MPVKQKCVFEQIVGSKDWKLVDAKVRDFHELEGTHTLQGEVFSPKPKSTFGRFWLYACGIPHSMPKWTKFKFHRVMNTTRDVYGIEQAPNAQFWQRRYPVGTMQSNMKMTTVQVPGERKGTVETKKAFDEIFFGGLVTVTQTLSVRKEDGALVYNVAENSVLWKTIRLPAILSPAMDKVEEKRCPETGRFSFDVNFRMPIFRTPASYQGTIFAPSDSTSD